MSKINLEFVGFKALEGGILVNDKIVKLKKEKNKNYTCEVETEEKTCNLVIYKSHYYSGKNWFWWNLLYFVVSVFGLFDIKHDKKCVVYDGRFNLPIDGDTNIVIKRQDFEDGGKLATIETTAQVEEVSNIQFYDKEARKRHRIMKKFKIAATIISLALITTLIVFL